MSMQDTFTRIWEEGGWIPPEGWAPRSGCGSSLRYTENIRRELPKLIGDFAIRSMFDAPCGDFTWMQTIRFPQGFVYRGGDIVEPLIRQLRARYPLHLFLHFDITTDLLPATDLLLCRDCLIHLSFFDIARMFANCLRSPLRYVLMTSYASAPNEDIVTGGYRPLDLGSPPFGFDRPLTVIEDWIEGFAPRSLMLWEIKAIERQMQRFVGEYRHCSG